MNRERLRQIRTTIVLPFVAVLMAVVVGSLFIYAADLIANKGSLDLGKPLAAYKALVERLAFDKLHHQVVRPDVVELADMRMIERGDGAGSLESLVRPGSGRIHATFISQPRATTHTRVDKPQGNP